MLFFIGFLTVVVEMQAGHCQPKGQELKHCEK